MIASTTSNKLCQLISVLLLSYWGVSPFPFSPIIAFIGVSGLESVEHLENRLLSLLMQSMLFDELEGFSLGTRIIFGYSGLLENSFENPTRPPVERGLGRMLRLRQFLLNFRCSLKRFPDDPAVSSRTALYSSLSIECRVMRDVGTGKTRV